MEDVAVTWFPRLSSAMELSSEASQQEVIKLMAEVVSFDANVSDFSKELGRHESFAIGVRDSLMMIEGQDEAVGEWNGILEQIKDRTIGLSRVADATAEIKKTLGEKKLSPEVESINRDSKAQVNKTDIKVGKASTSKNSEIMKHPGRTFVRRCGKCLACKGSCNTVKRDPSVWCNICKGNKLGENTGSKSCKSCKKGVKN